MKKCPDCGCKLIETKKEVYCSKCGLVVEDEFLADGSWDLHNCKAVYPWMACIQQTKKVGRTWK
jgi:hypothetical protein